MPYSLGMYSSNYVQNVSNYSGNYWYVKKKQR